MNEPEDIQNQNTKNEISNAESIDSAASQDVKGETSNTNEQHTTQNMEVHHHPDLHHKPKKIKEYFLEFIMIFLAVTLGFFAENIREHIVDKTHEKQYLHSFYEDLQADEENLPRLINTIETQQIQPADSLFTLLPSITVHTPATSVYYSLRAIIRQQAVKIFVTSRTIEQIKNSGEMRLIDNKQIVDSLVDYYDFINYIDYLQQPLLQYKYKLKEDFPSVLKFSDYNAVADSSGEIMFYPEKKLYLASADPFVINKILLEVSEIRGLSNVIKDMTEELMRKGANIRKLITEKYGIEN